MNRLRLNTCIMVALAVVLLASAAFCADEWTTFRQNYERTGLVMDGGNGVLGAFRPTPTWLFPAPDQTERIMDNQDAGFTTSSAWVTATDGAVGYYYDDYLYTSTDDTGSRQAIWEFDFTTLKTATANFYVYVWIPSPGEGETREHTTDAHYTIEVDGTVMDTITDFDQTSGGNWVPLASSGVSARSYMVRRGQTLRIRLTNETAKKDGNGDPLLRTVLADAVKLRMDSGTVVASPAVSTTNKLVISGRAENYPLFNVGSYYNQQIGVVHGIGCEKDSNIAATTDDRGIEKWRFPEADANWIVNGISSSPALVMNGGTEYAYIPGADGTVYAINSDTGQRVSRFPGYFADEGAAESTPSCSMVALPGSSWSSSAGVGRQGAGYLFVNSIPTTDTTTVRSKVRWEFDVPQAADDKYYDVYAWIPPAGNNYFIPDARYTLVEWDTGTSTWVRDASTTAQVTQGRGGFWALVRSKFKVGNGASTVRFGFELTNETEFDYTPVRRVVADCMKLVPHGLVTFDMCSPAVDGDGYIYLGSKNTLDAKKVPWGRVYKLHSGDPEPAWVYPAMDEAPIGAIESSPAVYEGHPDLLDPSGSTRTVVVGSMDGRIYALNAKTGGLKWVFPSPIQTPLSAINSTTAVDTTGGDPIIYVGTTYNGLNGGGAGTVGKVYAIKDTVSGPQVLWTYPSDATNIGVVQYCSPLIMKQYGMAEQKVVIGSSGKSLLVLDGVGTPNGPGQPNTPVMDRSTGLGSPIYSSPAGTYVSYPAFADRNAAVPVPRLSPVAMAFTASGSRIVGVDLSTGLRDWAWELMGSAISSPAVCNNRIYISDTEGYTWAFSTGDPWAGGYEGWNSDLGQLPTTGTDKPDPNANSLIAAPEVDIFTRKGWEQFRDKYLEPTERSATDTFDSDQLRTLAAPYLVPRPAGEKLTFEWGEDFTIVVWNLLDRNRQDAGPANWHRRYQYDPSTDDPILSNNDPVRDDQFSEDYPGKIEITVASREPGAAADSTEKITLSGRQIDFFNDGKVINGKTHYANFYGFFVYTLDGSSASKPQTPGTRFTITAREIPAAPNQASDNIAVVDSSGNDLEIGINNPLGLSYTGPYGNTNITSEFGQNSSGVTQREVAEAQVNGNPPGMRTPVVWGGFTPHNKLSETRTLAIHDRSLLSTSGRRISKFRIERHDVRWTGNPDPLAGLLTNYLPWEMTPGDLLNNQPNASDDYPDVDLRRIRCRMQSNGLDPSQNSIDLTPGSAVGVIPAKGTWNVSSNPINFAVEVPQFQPANIPVTSGGALLTDPADLDKCGYTSYVFAYVDSNNNGMFDRPAISGLSSIIQQKVTGTKAEAFRMMEVKVHVPADHRAQIEDQRINLGEVPQGFGITPGPSGTLSAFSPNLTAVGTPTSGSATIAPAGFHDWFKPLTIKNMGNVNLVDVGMVRSNLYSDTVQRPTIEPTGDVIDGSGYLIPSLYERGYLNPSPCMITTLDALPIQPAANFVTGLFPPLAGPTNGRTFHKARVGGTPTELKVQDFPSWAPGGPAVQDKPSLAVAIPLGTPVGTYYGSAQLARNASVNPVPVSNSVDVVVTCTEARLTDGCMQDTMSSAPHLPHLDAGFSGATAPTMDCMPAAYINPVTNNAMLFWVGSRSGSTPTGSDPWYLYSSKLQRDKYSNWIVNGNNQWWSPANAASVFPQAGSLSNFFPGPPAGAPGNIVPNSVRFGSPSVVWDKVNGKSYLLFTGQAYKNDGGRQTLESRAYYTDITDDTLDSGEVFSTSPNTTGNPFNGDWTTPKFGLKGAVIIRDSNSNPDLWSFWYGGGNGKWRIHYNVKRNSLVEPSNGDPTTQWTNEAVLPIPRGMISVAEPSPIVHYQNGATGPFFEVLYSGVSTFHNNSDIYLSKYESAAAPHTLNEGNDWPVRLAPMPQRGQEIPFMWPAAPVGNLPTSDSIYAEKLTRDVARGVWYSRDTDWVDDEVTGDARLLDGTDWKPSFTVLVKLNPDLPGSKVYMINIGKVTKDTGTGTIAYTYDPDPTDPAAIAAAKAELRKAFRAVVINPAEGTVKFMQLRDPVTGALLDPKDPPGQPQLSKKMVVVAQYQPRAYRLTTDVVADSSPFAVMDDEPNPRWHTKTEDGNPFYLPQGNWNSTAAPPTDRLWAFWRRPTMDKPGTGIYYKALRYTVQLNDQIGLNAKTSGGVNAYTPAITLIESVPDPEGTPPALSMPIEVDWVKNRLYFCGADATYTSARRDMPVRVRVQFRNAKNQNVEEYHYVQYMDEDFGQSGRTFGNLTSLMVNEGQVSAFKEPGVNRLWVFWASTRFGNSDLFYETISPKFAGEQYK